MKFKIQRKGRKSPRHKVFCEPETIHYKKINKSILNTLSFNLEENNHEEVNFNREALTFTWQLVKI